MKDFDVSWILNLKEMRPKPGDDSELKWKKKDEMVEYVKNQSHGSLALETSSQRTIFQLKPLPWSYVFDLIKTMAPKNYLDYAPEFVVLVDWPSGFTPARPMPRDLDTMLATYNSEKDAILLRVFTGDYIEHRGDEDGFGEEPDEHEVLEGLRDRDGKWIEELKLTWV